MYSIITKARPSLERATGNAYTHSSAAVAGSLHTVRVDVSDGTTTSQSWSVTVNLTSTRKTIFSDDFESGWQSQWTQSDASHTTIASNQYHSSSHSARITERYDGSNQGYITLQISTTGYTSIQLSCTVRCNTDCKVPCRHNRLLKCLRNAI